MSPNDSPPAAPSDDASLPPSMRPPYVIVCAVDLSNITEAVLEHALDTASRHARTTVHVVTVVPAPSGLIERIRAADHDAELAEAERTLRARLVETASAFAGSLTDPDARRLRLHVRFGQPAEEIAELSDEVEADLVVLGQHGWGGKQHRLVGTVSERVTRLVHCSLLLVQPGASELREQVAEAPCPSCVEVRRDSAGDTWFCQQHRDARGPMLTALVPWSELSTRPGGLY